MEAGRHGESCQIIPPLYYTLHHLEPQASESNRPLDGRCPTTGDCLALEAVGSHQARARPTSRGNQVRLCWWLFSVRQLTTTLPSLSSQLVLYQTNLKNSHIYLWAALSFRDGLGFGFHFLGLRLFSLTTRSLRSCWVRKCQDFGVKCEDSFRSVMQGICVVYPHGNNSKSSIRPFTLWPSSSCHSPDDPPTHPLYHRYFPFLISHITTSLPSAPSPFPFLSPLPHSPPTAQTPSNTPDSPPYCSPVPTPHH